MIIHQPHASIQWTQQGPGLEFSLLRAGDGGSSTMFVRMAAGSHAPLHTHAGGEETYLVSGCLRVGEHVLRAGDYLWTPPGVEHDGHAEEDTTFFVVLPEGLQFSGAPAT